ncbi:MAG: choice-of-anchor J domain-containing protein, partial [Bacteroidaceae bacterium]|nr:choice-of-anchor J domain-containing protein [Bacteroidaceae bacterium]
GKPAYWGLTVTNATYSQSADAHSGASAVLIEGNAQSNKRLASKSYTLKAGTYHMSAYFKQSGEAAGQFRLGYAKLTDGVVADTQNDYIYITSATPVSQEWQEVKCEFTLNAETEVGIIIMNSKYGGGASILVDDVTIITADGGIVEGTEGEEPEQPETPETGGSLFAESFATSLGSFTTQETIGNFPWTFDERYGAKASGYDQTSQDAESWLISPAINFTGINTAYISFDYVINKGDASLAAADHKVMVTESYTGDVATTNWIEVPYGAYNDGSWNFHNTGNIALPEAIMNNSAVVIAFKYTSTTANSSTWELKNVVVAAGEGETPEEPETPDTPDTPEEPEEPDTPAAEAGVFDFTNPEGLTPAITPAATASTGVELNGVVFTNGNVSISTEQGNASYPARLWTTTKMTTEFRAYNMSTITISVSEGTISSIVFEGSKVSAMTPSTGSFNAGTWSGSANSVTFNVTGTLNVQKVTVK